MRELHLFAGAGGGILGGLLLGHVPVGAVEFDAYCRRVLEARQADGCLVVGVARRAPRGSWRSQSGGSTASSRQCAGSERGSDGIRTAHGSARGEADEETEAAAAK